LLHFLSAEWGEVLRAGAGTLQTQATIFCIAVEAILRLVFEQHTPEVDRDRDALTEVQQWVTRIRQMLEAEGCPEPLRRRFDGLLSNMMGLSNRERFAMLAILGAIDLDVAQRWQRLRPVSAHGSREGQGDSDPLYYECMAVLGLLYQLVAHLIDYQGHLRNFSARGWPVQPYPFLVPPPPASAGGTPVG
jgi:hypothetical protein